MKLYFFTYVLPQDPEEKKHCCWYGDKEIAERARKRIKDSNQDRDGFFISDATKEFYFTLTKRGVIDLLEKVTG